MQERGQSWLAELSIAQMSELSCRKSTLRSCSNESCMHLVSITQADLAEAGSSTRSVSHVQPCPALLLQILWTRTEIMYLHDS